MTRKKIGRENRKKGKHTADEVRRAIELYYNGVSLRKASKESNVAYPTLRRYILKYKNDPNCSLTPNYEVRSVFSPEHESDLKHCVVECAKRFYGVSVEEIRRIAYQMAIKNNIPMPSTWITNEKAGKDWCRGFREKYPEVHIRKLVSSTIARDTGLHEKNVNKFFGYLKYILQRFKNNENGERIYNLDKTTTSKCNLVTTCLIVNAVGQVLPPVMVFSCNHFEKQMLDGAPTDTLGLYSESGRMSAQHFVEAVKHFIKHTSASCDNPAVLIMDNDESHLSIEALDLAQSSGVTVLIVPSHATSTLQPLKNVGIKNTFDTHFNTVVDSWKINNPENTLSIYHIADCIGHAILNALTPVSIKNAFIDSGIYPLNESIFSDVDILPSDIFGDFTKPHTSNAKNEARDISHSNDQPRQPKPLSHDLNLAHEEDAILAESIVEEVTIKNDPLEEDFQQEDFDTDSNDNIGDDNVLLKNYIDTQSKPRKRRKRRFSSHDSSHFNDQQAGLSSPVERKPRIYTNTMNDSDKEDEASQLVQLKREKLENSKQLTKSIQCIAASLIKLTEMVGQIRDVVIKK